LNADIWQCNDFKGKSERDTLLAKEGEEYPGMTYEAPKHGWKETDTFKNSFQKKSPFR
jgi:hypothetical protein